MPRMFDILRGKAEEANRDVKKEETAQQASPNNQENKENIPPIHPVSFPKEILNPLAPEQAEESEDYTLVSKKLISVVKQHGVDSHEKAEEIYDNAVETIRNLILKVRIKGEIDPYMDKLFELLDNIFNQLVLGDNILNNIYEKKKSEFYLAYHITNVLILSLVFGLNMGFNKSRLSHLGLASIFYDLGMDSLREITSQPRPLNEEELSLVRSHVAKSIDIVEKITTVNDIVKETIRQHHERVNGAGYPRGMKLEKINPYARILGLVDTYEALTHSRPYREGMNTHKAVRFLIGSLKNDFDPDAMKLFINKMSVYPIGSIVKLDTEEIARVVSVQPGSPLRPIVMILRDSRGEPIQGRVIIDLSKQDFPSIKDSI